MTENQMIKWVNDIIARALLSQSHGSITINLHAGKVMNVETRHIEKPPLDNFNSKS